MTKISGMVEGESREWTLFVGGPFRDLRDYPTLVKPNAKSHNLYQVATFRLEGKKRELKKLCIDAYLFDEAAKT